MNSPFLEVFSEIQFDSDLEAVLKDCVITNVAVTTSKDVVRFYTTFKTLIPHRRIEKLQDDIKAFLYPDNDDIRVFIIENYQLSSQYTPEILFSRYRDSMLDELSSHNKFLETMLKKAEVSFTDDTMYLTIEDVGVYKNLCGELEEFIESVFNKRCNQNVSIEFNFKQAEKSNFIEESELILQNKIDAISARTLRATKQEEILAEDKVEGDDRSKEFKAKAMEKKNSPKPDRQAMPLKRSDNPDVIYGKDFDDDTIAISEVIDGIGSVCIHGEILTVETRGIRNEKTILMFNISDYTDTIMIKLFLRNDQVDEMLSEIKTGKFIKVKGVVALDTYNNDLGIARVDGIMKSSDFRVKRMDNSSRTRVELHCHTKMSEFDGVSTASSIVSTAADWGHKAIAITDHGVVQAFCDAWHKASDLKKKDKNIKIIYGCEVYLVDDTKQIVTKSDNQPLEGQDYVVFDLETTGFSANKNKIIEIGAVKVRDGKVIDTFSEFVNPKEPIPYRIVELTSITDDMVINAPTIDEILPKFMDFCQDSVMVAHNADFDMSFIDYNCHELDLTHPKTYVDTVALSRFLLPGIKNNKLDTVAKVLNVRLDNHHRAVDDATCTAYIFIKLVEKLLERDINTLDLVNEEGKLTPNDIKKLPAYHCIILAKNDIGRINLYKLISESHLNYFYRRPKMPKSLIEANREGLIIGSACEAGELFRAMISGRSDEDIARIVDFYDYLEVQPIGNNNFMLNSDKYPYNTKDDLRDANAQIVRLGEIYNKPVVATCDVHFLNPEDEIYRRILMAGKGFDDADDQAPLYLHTTEEMLEEFSYLGSDKAYEIVVENTNMIADMIDIIDPVRPDKAPPVIENSDEDLRRICYTKAHDIYGQELPEIVEERLERELNSIIGNGYAVMYIIAQKLVWKSVEDGYLVGSRGSVGSSFAATMAGITEVNPLSPHYICPECKYSDFDSPEVLEFSGRAGCDMPDKICPKCGHKLNKDGFDIPFETFLGFKGNKEPDIDLNFSNDYQSKAHKYAEVIFGEGQTYKAGTVGTVAEKTAYGYVKKYYEERGINKRGAEIDRIAKGCQEVRTTTGQHPGGVIVLPMGENIYSFTPIQHPANKDIDIITTHFDYHSIDSNLLKLDMLGHLDPTMIKMLEDLTGVDATTIPLDDPKVLSLFNGTEALGVTPDKLFNKCEMGTLGIPEFGTDNAMNMLHTAKPTEFTDLVRISGLSHGTDVWQGNAEELIKAGIATISTAICTRDDIMTYLIHKGLDSAEAFDIMEKVRKGAVAKGKVKEDWEKWKADMKAHDVPDWYIGSCEKIQYMFPKAHAAAYVMMGWRVGWFKIYYPLAYYAAFFSIRAKGFNYEKMCLGETVLVSYLEELKAKKDSGQKLTATEDDAISDGRLVQEMYARGFEFMPMDLYKSDSRYFQIVDGKLLPPFNCIGGMGDTAAETLQIAASQGVFLSKEDLRTRGKVSQSIMEVFDRIGVTSGMTESNQISLFDL